MQRIHIVNCDFEHDFALVRRYCANCFAQVSNLLPLSNSFIRFHETHEFGKLALFQCSNNEYVSHHFLAKEMNGISMGCPSTTPLMTTLGFSTHPLHCDSGGSDADNSGIGNNEDHSTDKSATNYADPTNGTCAE